VLDVLERAGRWVGHADLERWATGDDMGWGEDFSRLAEAGIIEERWVESAEGRFHQYRLWGLTRTTSMTPISSQRELRY
jgi:hypothetical protein